MVGTGGGGVQLLSHSCPQTMFFHKNMAGTFLFLLLFMLGQACCGHVWLGDTMMYMELLFYGDQC